MICEAEDPRFGPNGLPYIFLDIMPVQVIIGRKLSGIHNVTILQLLKIVCVNIMCLLSFKGAFNWCHFDTIAIRAHITTILYAL